MNSGSKRTFLKKGGGVSGRLMSRITYPALKKSQVQQNRSDSYEATCSAANNTESVENASDNEGSNSSGFDAQTSPCSPSKQYDELNARPVTAGTADSGCPDDDDEVVVTPDILSPIDSLRSVIPDVSAVGSSQSVQSSTDPRGFIEKASQPVVPNAVHSPTSHTVGPAAATPGNFSSAVDSTAEFERVEAAVEANYTSSASDKASTEEFNRFASEFRKISRDCLTEYSSSSITTLAPSLIRRSRRKHWDKEDVVMEDSTPQQQPFLHRLERLRRSDGIQRRPLRESFPNLLEQRSSGSPETDVVEEETESVAQSSRAALSELARNRMDIEPKNGRHLRHAYSTPVLERYATASPEGLLAREILEKPILFAKPKPTVFDGERILERSSRKLSGTERALAKQLRDLLTYMDLATEENRRRSNELEEEYSKLLRQHADLLTEKNNLTEEVKRLKDTEKLQLDELAALQKTDQLRNAELNRLKRDLSTLKKQQKTKEDEESEVVKLLKQRAEDFRGRMEEKDRIAIDFRAQKKAAESRLKLKEKEILELKNENERLSARLKAITDEKAQIRGRNAEGALSQQALIRASTRPPITAASKRLGLLGARGNTAQAVPAPDWLQINPTNAILKARTDDSVDTQTSVRAESSQKSVRWNEPLTTVARLSPQVPHTNFYSDEREPNSDMRLIQTGENEVGMAAKYRGANGDFAVYTRTFCGCSLYEYSNNDVRWIHSSGHYQINYYGQWGTTTVELKDNLALIRHFSDGQLEIYRANGDVTLISPSGRRIETLKRSSGNGTEGFYIEFYEDDKNVHTLDVDGKEVRNNGGQSSVHRSDGSYVHYVPTDGSLEFRAGSYVVRRFKDGNVKIQLTQIDTTVSILMADIGTVKHGKGQRCVEWGRNTRAKSRRLCSGPEQYGNTSL